MSTTFGIKTTSDGKVTTIEIARRVGGRNGAEMFWINDLAEALPDNQLVEALDNSPQGIFTIGDIRNHISNQENNKRYALLNDEEWMKFNEITRNYVSQGLRIGQSYMNALYEVSPEIYKEVRGTDNDCFYDDKNIINLISFLN